MPLVSRRASRSDGFRAFSHRQWLSFNRGARNTANVRFGSLADIPPHADDVRSTPKKADMDRDEQVSGIFRYRDAGYS